MKKAGKERKPSTTTVIKASKPKRSQLAAATTHHVDPAATAHLGPAAVHADKDTLFSARLHRVDMGAEENRELHLQVLRTDNGSYYLWERMTHVEMHYGHDVALDASSTKCVVAANVGDALHKFQAAFLAKTGITWRNRFLHDARGDYTFVDVDLGRPQHLTSEVRHVMALLPPECNFRPRTPTPTPLPVLLSKHTIDRAIALLDEMRSVLATAPSRTRQRSSLVLLSNHFYALVPHCFGHEFIGRHVLDTSTRIDTMASVLTTHFLVTPKAALQDPLYVQFQALRCDLQLLSFASPARTLIQTYFDNTKAPLKFSLTLRCVYQVDKQIESDRFQAFATLHNRKLLWHGSALTNWSSILQSGLKIAPANVRTNGQSFGTGLYFSDSVSRSVGYCHSNKVGLLALCEVALGTPYVTAASDASAKRRVDGVAYDSVHGYGSYLPDSGFDHIMPDGVTVPMGKLARSDLATENGLEYNEYIVYNTAQMRMRYLVVADFDTRVP
ncbi:hypothetical protein SPRG_04562 [Saprolegnia parasitica CBS 223.65]|uniref:Poly [ADP-ribose] polymerase n=1 Tax=Saprolegnia parasitica (strain CBS 223.65) TaxID=695850 RepID=A0A067CVY5_SAPPC|nr:hypothetical protein SPRG_04562 [Saprolegnia parasitica CBS 223.65]KDO30661.1 hypothetical protein SPRG_04562 [Saprolegnia parasitica CBS 223.65]|eukprot:XP_012198365.1 hypothetical protein SPRG_04562 [Saprolegnia parasitica CBS 223.65]